MRECEIRILEIEVDEWISFLESHGAVKVGEWLQKRKVYDFKPVDSNKWLRLRTNGTETTLTIKEILDSSKIDGVRELEVVVSDYDKMSLILEELGYKARSIQENRRIRYLYEGVEFDIDTWPLIPTYVEIEGKTTLEVEGILKKISLDTSKRTTLDVDSIYQEIYHLPTDWKVLTFEEQVR